MLKQVFPAEYPVFWDRKYKDNDEHMECLWMNTNQYKSAFSSPGTTCFFVKTCSARQIYWLTGRDQGWNPERYKIITLICKYDLHCHQYDLQQACWYYISSRADSLVSVLGLMTPCNLWFMQVIWSFVHPSPIQYFSIHNDFMSTFYAIENSSLSYVSMSDSLFWNDARFPKKNMRHYWDAFLRSFLDLWTGPFL